jgi:hypothetical protein
MSLKKHNPGCNCCPGGLTCEGVGECLGIVFDGANWDWTRRIEITFDGCSNDVGICDNCDVLNATHLFPVFRNQPSPCGLDFQIAVLGICFSTIQIVVGFHLRRNNTGGWEIEVFYGNIGGGPFGASYFHPDVFVDETLCDGGALIIPSITAPYPADEGIISCAYDGSPAILRIV